MRFVTFTILVCMYVSLKTVLIVGSTYTALVEMCVHQIHQLATACQFNVGEQELETKDVELTDSNEGNECLIR